MSEKNICSGSLSERESRPAFRLLYASTARYNKSWHSTPHSHSCAELFYILCGRGQFKIADRLYEVEGNDFVIINPHVLHTELSTEDNPLEYIVLGISGLELCHESGDRSFSILKLGDCAVDIYYYLRSLLHELEEREPGYEEICQDLLDLLLRQLLRCGELSSKAIPGENVSRESAAVRRYIEAHFKENVSLDELAEAVRLNKFHMTHLFTRDYGISPIKLLLKLRIDESCRLLRSTDHSLAEIALITGFSSPSYFSQSFRRVKGMSPTDYRRSFSSGLPLPGRNSE